MSDIVCCTGELRKASEQVKPGVQVFLVAKSGVFVNSGSERFR